MPTVYRVGSLRFFFYANDHKPIHVHVEGYGGKAKVILDPSMTIESSSGFSPRDLKRIREVCSNLKASFIEEWEEFFHDD